jgi:hypothetical protein
LSNSQQLPLRNTNMPTEKDFVGITDFAECLARVRGTTRGMVMTAMPSPQELHAIYARGFQGVRPDIVPIEEKKAYKELITAMPRLYEVFPWAKDIGKGKINCPYVAIMFKDKEWGGRDAQAVGDCTVHGTRNACSMDYALDALFGETEYLGSLALENIYKSRGFNSHGWSCEAPCMYVGPEGKGGLLYRKVYSNGSETVDLTEYNPTWESSGRSGTPTWIEEESRKNKVKWVCPISEAPEYRDAIAIGFGINVCSGQGYASTTDENGIAEARGSWSHSMAHVAAIDTPWASQKYSTMIGGVQQSWGNWNTIKGKPEASPNMPTGMFYSRWAPIQRMLSGQDSFAMCGVQGWSANIWTEFAMMPKFDDKSRRAYGEKLREHLRNSTTQDYYLERAKKLQDLTKQATEENMWAAI